jgi:sulfite reductase (ferredoxin)
MQRIKIPYGGLNPEQMKCWPTWPRNIPTASPHHHAAGCQLHFVHIEDTPDLMWRLAAVGITTREACGNSVRNVTACPSPASAAEAFDVTPYANAITLFCWAIATCRTSAANSKSPFPAAKRSLRAGRPCTISAESRSREQSTAKPGADSSCTSAAAWAVPHQAKLYDEFVPEEELLPICRGPSPASSPGSARRRNRNTRPPEVSGEQARHRRIRRLVQEERAHHAGRSGAGREHFERRPHTRKSRLPCSNSTAPAAPRASTNGRHQSLPAAPARILRRHRHLPAGRSCHGRRRCASLADFPQVCRRKRPHHRRAESRPALDSARQNHRSVQPDLSSHRPGQSGSRARSSTSPPAPAPTPASSASPPRAAWPANCACAWPPKRQLDAPSAVLRIKVSGCFNSCGQHHVADIGFYGNSRNKNGYTVPHFQVMLGGNGRKTRAATPWRWARCPPNEFPETCRGLTGRYVAERLTGRNFPAFCQRIGKQALQGDRRRVHRRPAAQGGRVVLQRLGRSARIHHRRHGRRRMRRRNRLPHPIRIHAGRERGLRGPASSRCRKIPRSRRKGLSGDAHRRQDAGAIAMARRPR